MNKSTKAQLAKNAAAQSPLLERIDYWIAGAIAVAFLLLYALTAAPSVTVEDSGDFILGAVTLGIVHPPGYPLYTILTHLMTLLPFGSIPFRVNLFSGICGAGTLGLLYLVMRLIRGQRFPSVIAVMSVGLTSVFWSYSVIAEVYTLNAFFLTLFIFSLLSALLRFNLETTTDKKEKYLLLASMVAGLGLSHHYPLFILSLVGLIFLIERPLLKGIKITKVIAFFTIGLLPLLYLAIQAYRSEQLLYNFGKLSSFSDVIDHFLRTRYGDQAGGTFIDKIQLVYRIIRMVVEDFTVFAVFIGLGLIPAKGAKWKYRRPFLISLLCSSVLLIFLLTFPDDLDHRTFIRQYLLPSFIFLSFFEMIAIQEFLNRMPWKKVGHWCLVAILPFQFALNFSRSNHHEDRLIELWSKALLENLEPNSVLILCGTESFALYYYHLIEKLRPDITMYDRFSLITRENLYGPGYLWQKPDGKNFQRSRELEFINTSTRPVYADCNDITTELALPYSISPFTYRFKGTISQPVAQALYRLDQAFLNELFASYPKGEHWHDKRRKSIIVRLSSYFASVHSPDLELFLQELKKSRFYQSEDLVLKVANNMIALGNVPVALDLFRDVIKSSGSLTSFYQELFCNGLAQTGAQNSEEYKLHCKH